MKTMKLSQRICVGSALTLASLFALPAIAGATPPTDPGCYTGCTPPTVNNNVVSPPPTTDPVQTAATVANGSTSLPFTGADVGELAAIGVGAVVVGGVLARRRRSAS